MMSVSHLWHVMIITGVLVILSPVLVLSNTTISSSTTATPAHSNETTTKTSSATSATTASTKQTTLNTSTSEATTKPKSTSTMSTKDESTTTDHKVTGVTTVQSIKPTSAQNNTFVNYDSFVSVLSTSDLSLTSSIASLVNTPELFPSTFNLSNLEPSTGITSSSYAMTTEKSTVKQSSAASEQTVSSDATIKETSQGMSGVVNKSETASTSDLVQMTTTGRMGISPTSVYSSSASDKMSDLGHSSSLNILHSSYMTPEYGTSQKESSYITISTPGSGYVSSTATDIVSSSSVATPGREAGTSSVITTTMAEGVTTSSSFMTGSSSSVFMTGSVNPLQSQLDSLQQQVDSLEKKNSDYVIAVAVLSVVIVLLIAAAVLYFYWKRRTEERKQKRIFLDEDITNEVKTRPKYFVQSSTEPGDRIDGRFSTASYDGGADFDATPMGTFTRNKETFGKNGNPKLPSVTDTEEKDPDSVFPIDDKNVTVDIEKLPPPDFGDSPPPAEVDLDPSSGKEETSGLLIEEKNKT